MNPKQTNATAPVDAVVSVRMKEGELMVAFEAIANERMRCLCSCDYSVGWTCGRCRRLGEKLLQRNIDLAWNYAKLLLKAAR